MIKLHEKFFDVKDETIEVVKVEKEVKVVITLPKPLFL